MDRRGFITSVLGSGLAGSLAGCDRITPLLTDHVGSLRGRLRTLRVDHDLCIGCRLCEDACHEINSGGEIDVAAPARSLIHVHGFLPGPYHVAWACLGCPDRPCVRACDYFADPFGHRRALDIHPDTGAVALDRDACAGCERCIVACEQQGGGVLRWDEEALVAGACHLCGGDPECARACPMDAISVETVEPGPPVEARRPEEAARGGLDRLRGRGLEPEGLCEGGASLGALRVDPEKCTGCRLCEAACDEANGPRPEDAEASGGPGDVTRSLIRIHTYPLHVYIAWSCLGCADLPCVAACRGEAHGSGSSRALHLDPASGSIRFSAEWCQRCQECLAACEERGGDVLRVDAGGMISGACHLCDGDPACLRECPMDAIELVVVDRSVEVEVRQPAEAGRRATAVIFGQGGGAT